MCLGLNCDYSIVARVSSGHKDYISFWPLLTCTSFVFGLRWAEQQTIIEQYFFSFSIRKYCGTWAPSGVGSSWTLVQVDQSLLTLETIHLISFHPHAGWSEISLGNHVWRFLFPRGSPIDQVTRFRFYQSFFVLYSNFYWINPSAYFWRIHEQSKKISVFSEYSKTHYTILLSGSTKPM